MPGFPTHAAGTAKQLGKSAALQERTATGWGLLSLRRAVAGALQHPKVGAPRTNGCPVLVGHNP